MKIVRFGNVFNTAFRFDDYKATYDFDGQRVKALGDVGGVGGAFDYAGTRNFEIGASEQTQVLMIRSRTYQGVDAALQEVLRNTYAVDSRRKLWAVARDESTLYWAWAKCVGKRHTETAGKNYFGIELTLKWSLSEGVWYGAQQSFTPPGDEAVWSEATQYNFTLDNGGMLPCPLDTFGDFATLGEGADIQLDNFTNGYRWALANLPETVSYLYMQPSIWRVTYLYSWYPGFASRAAYSYLTYSQVQQQETWMRLEPGVNTMRLTVSANTAIYPEFSWQPVFAL